MFEFELELRSETPVAFEDVIGSNMTVRVKTQGGTRFLNGFVCEFRQVDDGQAHRLLQYRATLVPWFWFLTQTADCRIFQNQSVPEIAKALFEEYGFTDFEDRLSETYETLDYCVQYRESIFAFISRLFERSGIYYYFEHEDGRHNLILCDSPAAHVAAQGYETVCWHPPDDTTVRDTEEYLSEWSPAQRLKTSCVALNDFDFTVPTKSLATRAVEAGAFESSLQCFDYPGQYTTYEQGEHLARVRLEEHYANACACRAAGPLVGLGCGHTFHLDNHPQDTQNAEYTTVSSTYTIESDEFESSADASQAALNFRTELEAIPVGTSFRPARKTPEPYIRGPQTAIVCGKDGEEIWTDEFGRVKLQFHWDREGAADENTSCWVRVAQVWAGKHWGTQFIPRVGQEVIVEFLEGDPDRPIVTGRVYNDSTKPPYDLPAMKTVSTIKSNSSKDAQGFNELRFDDKAGEEQVFLHAQKNLDLRVVEDRFETVGHDRNLEVENDKREEIKNDRHEKVTNHHYEEIGGDRHLKVTGKEAKAVEGSKSLTVTDDVIEKFEANHSHEVTDDLYIKADNIVIEAATNITITVGDSYIAIDSDGIKVYADGDLAFEASGDVEISADGDIAVSASGDAEVSADGDVTVSASGSAAVESQSGTTVDSSGNTEITGSMVQIN